MAVKAISYQVKKYIDEKKEFYNRETRYRLVDSETGEILDDAQGYGYKSAQKAYASYAYKNRDKNKDKEKARKTRHIKSWLASHQEILQAMDNLAFDVAKGVFDCKIKFNSKLVQQLLDEEGLTPDFTADELIRVWKNMSDEEVIKV